MLNEKVIALQMAINLKKNHFFFRLSAIAGSRLKDGNPIIADLSDDNRPLKIAERFSEIYDNEWTDVFDDLITDKSERESIHILLDILQVHGVNKLCKIRDLYSRKKKTFLSVFLFHI